MKTLTIHYMDGAVAFVTRVTSSHVDGPAAVLRIRQRHEDDTVTYSGLPLANIRRWEHIVGPDDEGGGE